MDQKLGIGIKALLAFSGLLAICGLGMCDVVINEFELSPPDNGTVWVEIYNTGDAAVDLTGWKINIVDKPWEGSISLKGSIEPKGFLAFDGQKSWVATGNGTIFLYDASGAEVDKTSPRGDNSQSDFTYGRLPDGKKTGTNADFALMMASKGRSNAR
ncbi:MAG: lamin tail domain-containing protein [Methanothrix sp.]|nr:lamin tail domain-containing protein [Methanothrix sp.]